MAPSTAGPSRRHLAVALDVATLDEARSCLDALATEVSLFKVGLELFTACGPDAVRAVHDRGAQCFLDLKLHDIPATVAGSVRAAARLGVRYLTVHAASGSEAMHAAVQAASGSSLQILAVTVLTSLDAGQLQAVGFTDTPAERAHALAKLATDAGADGIVASAQECASLRQALGAAPVMVVPGIRPASIPAHDQRRTATPAEAVRAGADVLVVGRPVRDADDPAAAARAIATEMAHA